MPAISVFSFQSMRTNVQKEFIFHSFLGKFLAAYTGEAVDINCFIDLYLKMLTF